MNVRNFQKKLNYNFSELEEYGHNYRQKPDMKKKKKGEWRWC